MDGGLLLPVDGATTIPLVLCIVQRGILPIRACQTHQVFKADDMRQLLFHLPSDTLPLIFFLSSTAAAASVSWPGAFLRDASAGWALFINAE